MSSVIDQCDTVGFALRIAETPWQRMRGLLGHAPLQAKQGLLIRPCNMIHTLGMRYAIDVAFMDRQSRILKVVASVAPMRLAQCLRAHAVLELAAGQAQALGLKVGGSLSSVLRATEAMSHD